MLIDLNAWTGRWPFHQSEDCSVDTLRTLLTNAGVTAACVASLESALIPDPIPVERKLGKLLRQQNSDAPTLIHTPVVCCSSSRWKTTIRTLHEEFGVPMIRLIPSYRPRGFTIERTAEVIHYAAELDIATAFVLRLEDERNQSPLLNILTPKPAEIVRLMSRIADIPFLLLNAYRSEIRTIRHETATDHVLFDTALIDGAGAFASLSNSTRPVNFAFGSGAPLYSLAAARRKLDCIEVPESRRKDLAEMSASSLLKLGHRLQSA